MKNPFAGVLDRVNEQNRIMQHWMQDYHTGQGQQGAHPDGWVPAIDVLMKESGDLVVLVELPGVGQEDIDLSLSGGNLTVSGRKDGYGGEGKYLIRERHSGTFLRTIEFPDGLSRDRISTAFDGCVLEITIHDYSEILEAERIEIGSEST